MNQGNIITKTLQDENLFLAKKLNELGILTSAPYYAVEVMCAAIREEALKTGRQLPRITEEMYEAEIDRQRRTTGPSNLALFGINIASPNITSDRAPLFLENRLLFQFLSTFVERYGDSNGPNYKAPIARMAAFVYTMLARAEAQAASK